MPLAVSVSTIDLSAVLGADGEGGGDGEGQGTSCWDPAATYPGHLDSHPVGEHVTVVAPFKVELEYEQLDVAVPAEVS